MFLNLLKNKNFSLLLSGYILSILVDSVVFMTLVKWLEIEGKDPKFFTIFYICSYFPAALLSLPIGAWIETRIFQNVMKYSTLIRVGLIILFLLMFHENPITIIFIYTIIESTIAIFFFPANDSLLPHIVKDNERAYANGIFKLLFVVIQTLGYMISTLLIKFNISFYVIFIISAILLSISVICVSKIKPYISNKENKGVPFISLMKDGLSYIYKKKMVKNMFFLFACAWAIASSIDLLIINYLTNIAKTGAENFGFVATATFTGMMVGASFAPKIYYQFERKWLFLLPLFIYSMAVFSMSLFSNWLLILPFFFLGGISFGIFEVYFTTFLQDETDSSHYARVFSIYTMILNSAPLPGLLLLGVWIESTSILFTINSIALFLLCVGVISAFTFPKINNDSLKHNSKST